MKRVQVSLVALALLMAFALPASAQKIHYGIKAGMNLAVQSGIGEYYSNDNIRVGLTAGLVGNYQINNNMMLQAELNYDQKGSHLTNIDTKYDYLSVPVLFDYSFGHAHHTKMSVHLNAGPYVAFLTRAQKTEKTDGASKTINLMDASHKAEAGALIGVGFRQPVGKHFLFWDVRLTVGITHFDIANTSSRNKMISVSMGYEL